MPNISATFLNNSGSSRRWVIVDLARDPNAPPVIFNDFLEKDESTPELALHSDDSIFGKAVYQRSDGPQQVVDVSNGDVVRMS